MSNPFEYSAGIFSGELLSTPKRRAFVMTSLTLRKRPRSEFGGEI
ncbi:MAG TPA: hypothetical protein VKD70_17445 [Candidatus Acidoferrum sp.]|nr:hypothetical protein [Candidatus Acidoferrum sp.]